MTGSNPIGGFASNITIDGSITTAAASAGLAISQAGPTSGFANQFIRIGANASITTYQVSDIFGRINETFVNAGSITSIVGLSINVAELSFTNSGTITSDGAALYLNIYGDTASSTPA